MDYTEALSYVLAAIAVAYFALEFLFTGLRGRLYGFVKGLLHR